MWLGTPSSLSQMRKARVREDKYSTQGYPAGKWWGRTWGQFFWAQPFIHLTLKFGNWSLISFCIPCRDSFFLNLSFLIYSCHPIIAEFWVVFVHLFRVCVFFQEIMYFTWFKIVLNMTSKYFLNRISPLKDRCIPSPSPTELIGGLWAEISLQWVITWLCNPVFLLFHTTPKAWGGRNSAPGGSRDFSSPHITVCGPITHPQGHLCLHHQLLFHRHPLGAQHIREETNWLHCQQSPCKQPNNFDVLQTYYN